MQFFGARANLAKALLYAINGGKDEKFLDKNGNHMQVGPEYAPITSDYLDYNEVMHKYDQMLDWLAGLYVNILNLIQYMHDKYYYEAAEMALIDTDVRRQSATQRYASSVMTAAWLPTSRSRATSPVMEMMIRVPMISPYGC